MFSNHLFVLIAKEKGKPVTMVYVPSHLYHMVFELYKVLFKSLSSYMSAFYISKYLFSNVKHLDKHLSQNAMRATMELYGDAMEYPSIHTQVALGTEDLTVKVNVQINSCTVKVKAANLALKTPSGFCVRFGGACVYSCCLLCEVSDRGGGVPLRKIDRLFTYTYSTAPRPSIDGSRAAPLVNTPNLSSLVTESVSKRNQSVSVWKWKQLYQRLHSWGRYPAIPYTPWSSRVPFRHTYLAFAGLSHVPPIKTKSTAAILPYVPEKIHSQSLCSSECCLCHGAALLFQTLSGWTLLHFSLGWLWVWPAHLTTVRSLLSRRPQVVFYGGLRNRCCDLHTGNLVSQKQH